MRVAEFWRSRALPHLEARRSCQENPCYRPHAHDAFSVGLIDEGRSVLSGCLDGTIRLQPGDVVVIPAGQVHACNPEHGAWRYQMVHMDQGWALALTGQEPCSALFVGISVFRRHDLRSRIVEMTDAIFADETRPRIEATVAALLHELEAVPPARLVVTDLTDAAPQLLTRLLPVMERLRLDESNPALSELAGLAGMSTFQLVRAMRRATGLSPLAWRQNARIAQARHLLRDGHPIAETAQVLGFADQSHFHRVFRSHVGATPGGYRG